MTPGIAIDLDRADRTYLQGEQVTGTVRVTAPEALDCDQLVVDLCYLFGGKLGQGEGIETTSVVFQGHLTAGTHALPFSVPVSAELPSYQGQLFTLTRLVRASLTPARGTTQTDVTVVWIACSSRDGAWFHPREQQPPPVPLIINGVPIRFTGLKRALESGIGKMRGRRRVASLEVHPLVLRGGDIVTITAVTDTPARGVGSLRARLRGVERWSPDDNTKEKVIHSEEFAATVRSDGVRTTVRIEVPVPEDAMSMAERLQWRIQLRGGYGCLDARDRWQPLWIGPSETLLARLRGRSTEEMKTVTADTTRDVLAADLRQRRRDRRWGVVFALSILLPFLGVALRASTSTRLWVLGWCVTLAAVIVLIARKKRSVDREFRDRQFRARSAALPDAVPLTDPTPGLTVEPLTVAEPPPAALRIDLVKLGETPRSPVVDRALRSEIIVTQRVVLRRGIRGLSLLLAVNILAALLATPAGLGSGFLIPLCGISVLVLAASLAAAPTGRPLSCYVGAAPVLVLCWLAASIVGTVSSVRAGIINGSPIDLLAGLLLATGVAVVVVRARQRQPGGDQARRLLVLWVFGATSRMEELLRQVTLQWTYLGPIQYLRGPGSRVDVGRWVTALRRGTRDLFADTLPDVMAHLRRFRLTPNIFGIYSINSLQCTNAVWRDAVDALLDTTDLVMMDLTTFGPKNQGCAYELGVLIDRISTSRFVLVVDGTTDIDLLTTLLHREWDEMPASSPNRNPNPGPIRLLRIPLPGAEAPGRTWSTTPMNDLVHLLFEPVAERV